MPITPEHQALVKTTLADTSDLVGFEVRSNDDREIAAGAIVECRSRLKTLESKRKEITDPLDKAKKAVLDLFRPAVQALKDGEAGLKKAIAAFDSEQARLEEAAYEAGDTQALAAIQPEPESACLTTYVRLQCEIHTPDLVPREYCRPDPKLVEAALKSGKVVPGAQMGEKTYYRSK